MIKYEFGGTEPTGRSMTYAEPFKLTTTTVVSAMAFLTDAEGAPIMDVEDLPIASPATFAEYVVKAEEGPTVDVENTIISSILVQDGMIVADGEYQIYTITGQNVTGMNGNLERGVYVVKVGNSTVKVIVK